MPIGEAGKSTRLVPQVVLSCGLCEPSLYGLAPVLVQTAVPLLFIVIVAVKVWPGRTPVGTLLLTTEALLPWPITIAASVFEVPLKTSPSTVPAPGTDAASVYCHTVQVDHGLVGLGAPVCAFWPFQLAIQGVHWVTVLSNQLPANELEA